MIIFSWLSIYIYYDTNALILKQEWPKCSLWAACCMQSTLENIHFGHLCARICKKWREDTLESKPSKVERLWMRVEMLVTHLLTRFTSCSASRSLPYPAPSSSPLPPPPPSRCQNQPMNQINISHGCERKNWGKWTKTLRNQRKSSSRRMALKMAGILLFGKAKARAAAIMDAVKGPTTPTPVTSSTRFGVRRNGTGPFPSNSPAMLRGQKSVLLQPQISRGWMVEKNTYQWQDWDQTWSKKQWGGQSLDAHRASLDRAESGEAHILQGTLGSTVMSPEWERKWETYSAAYP